jgi:FtsP/CotA-like multicopper oxidase with cupredoxin domain
MALSLSSPRTTPSPLAATLCCFFPSGAVDVGVNLDAAMSAGALTDGVLSSLENVDSVLINGKISHTVDVEHGKTYLVRVINAGFVSNFGIIGGSTAGKPAHKFSLVMADAHYVQPINNIEHVFFGALGSGQRLTFLFTADQNTGTHQYHVQSNLRLLGPTIMADGPDSAKLFFRYANPAPDHSFAEPGFLPPAGPQFLASETVFRADKTKRQFVQVPKKPDVMLTMQTGVTPTFQFIMAANTPFDLAPGLPFIAGNRRGAVYFDINEGDVVDIVIINTLLPHPYHSHMFSGWILAHGTGDFPGYEAVFPTFNLDNPVRRDTFQVEVDPPVQDILDQNGWAVYRIIANRRGPVAFHCHILSHHMTGMMAILNVGSPPDVPAPSSLFPFCGGYSPDDVDEPFFSASDLSSSSSTSSTSSDSSDSSSSSSSSKLHVGVVRPQVG